MVWDHGFRGFILLLGLASAASTDKEVVVVTSVAGTEGGIWLECSEPQSHPGIHRAKSSP